ncbi:Calcyclin-binding protein [Anthophora quadrimaculata]
MSTKADELKLDIEEFNNLLRQTSRQKCKDVLGLEIRRLQTELAKLVKENKTVATKSANVESNSPKYYEVKLNNYGWDQTNTTVKLYITLKDVHQLPKESVICDFTENSLNLRVVGLDNKNYNLAINNLCEEIDVNNSTVKTKTDMVIISLAKKVAKNWSHVTGVEKRITESKASSMADLGDDNDSDAGMNNLMSLMKKMYQEGDDEMKRTIAKALTESQEKRGVGLSDFS